MKKTIKKIISVLLFSSVLFTSFPHLVFQVSSAEIEEQKVGATSGTTGDCTWILDDDGTLTISGNGAMDNYSREYVSSVGIKTTAPWGYDLKSVVIQNGVTSIGDAAFFGCSNLTNISISDSVTSINSYSFCACTNLSSVIIPDSVASIGDGAFHNTAWYNNQPDGLFYVGKFAYEYKGRANMPANTSIIIQDGTKGIVSSAFSNCRNLKAITIPDSVITIGHDAFSNCSNLLSVVIPDKVTSINSYAFYKCTSLTSVTIGNNVTSIGGYAFYGCTSMTSINIPDSVTSIDVEAFLGCSNLINVTIPDSVTNIGDYAIGYYLYRTVYNKYPDFIIYGKLNSEAQNYAERNGILFEEYTICPHCNTVLFGEEIIVLPSIAPTCTETGLTEGSHCSACGTILTPQETIPATGHNYSLSVTPPSCNENGYTTYTCSNYGDAYTSDYVEAINHDYAVTTKEATCTEKGQITYTCKVCSYSYSVDTEMVEHSIVIDDAIPATCTESGLTEGCHCSVCNTVISAQETIPATGHTEVVDNGYEATCETEGLSDGCHCSVCNTVIVSQEPIPAAGHHWDNGLITKEATYTETGEILFTCTTCGTSKTETIPCVEKRGKIVVSNEVVKAGDEVNVKIYIEENPGIAGLSIDVIFPEELTLKEVNYTDLFTSKPSNSQGYLNPFTISWLSVQSSDRCETGLFATLTFATDIDAELSDYTIQVTYQENNIVDGTPTAIPFDIINGTVTINKPTSGDVNRDGAINMKDLVLIQQYINHWNVSIVERAADVDNDGGITMKDLVILQQYINGWEVELK